jgi:hypothetical protein
MLKKGVTLQKFTVPIGLIVWTAVMVAGLSYSPPEQEFGEISGIVTPNNIPSYVYVIYDDKIVASVQTDTDDGMFLVSGLSEENYSLEVRPVSNNYTAVEIQNVVVKINELTDLGMLDLKPATAI